MWLSQGEHAACTQNKQNKMHAIPLSPGPNTKNIYLKKITLLESEQTEIIQANQTSYIQALWNWKLTPSLLQSHYLCLFLVGLLSFIKEQKDFLKKAYFLLKHSALFNSLTTDQELFGALRRRLSLSMKRALIQMEGEISLQNINKSPLEKYLDYEDIANTARLSAQWLILIRHNASSHTSEDYCGWIWSKRHAAKVYLTD